MAASTCSTCGSALLGKGRFCGQCGAVTPEAPPESPPRGGAAPPKTAADNALGRTLIDARPPAMFEHPEPAPATPSLHKTLVDTSPPIAATRPTEPGAPPLASPPRAGSQTMVGFAPPPGMKLGVTAAAPPPAALPKPDFGTQKTMVGVSTAEPPRAAPAAAQAPPLRSNASTMLGVAIPGIAPLRAGQDQAPPAQGPTPMAANNRTMLGVALPGIAPLRASEGVPGAVAAPRSQPRQAVEIVPMPPPLVDDEPLPQAPERVKKKGLPLGVVAGLVAAVVLVAGVAIFFLWRSPPLVAQPRLDAQGHEELHLRCESCKDGTVVSLDDAKTTFTSKEANLPLTKPLNVGENTLTLHLDRPNLGRDEAVKVSVPIAFRIRADLADIGAAHPTITVRVEALPGTDVSVDGKPVSLDAKGTGAYALDMSSETEGPTDEARVIDRNIAYVVTPKSGVQEKGTVTARVAITPLHIDAPGLHAVVDTATFHIAGRTLKGGTVTANGRPVHTDPDGSFAQPFDAPAQGDLPIELRAVSSPLAPRTAHIVVRRVPKLADEAKAREQAPSVGYDAIAADVAGNVGRDVVVAGEVVEARVTTFQTVAIVDDARGCAHAPCLVRVVYGGEDRVKHGDAIRAYGRVTRAVTSGGATVPEVEADFLLKGRAAK